MTSVYKQFSLKHIALSIRNVKSNLNPDHSDAIILTGALVLIDRDVVTLMGRRGLGVRAF